MEETNIIICLKKKKQRLKVYQKIIAIEKIKQFSI